MKLLLILLIILVVILIILSNSNTNVAQLYHNEHFDADNVTYPNGNTATTATATATTTTSTSDITPVSTTSTPVSTTSTPSTPSTPSIPSTPVSTTSTSAVTSSGSVVATPASITTPSASVVTTRIPGSTSAVTPFSTTSTVTPVTTYTPVSTPVITRVPTPVVTRVPTSAAFTRTLLPSTRTTLPIATMPANALSLGTTLPIPVESQFGKCIAQSQCGGGKCSLESLHPIMDPRFNMREAAKQCLLLEDHLNNTKKRCYDCIRKHFLTIDGLLEEAVSLEVDNVLRDYYRKLHIYWIKIEKTYARNPADSNNLDNVSKEIRGFRKPLLEQYFDNVSEYED